MVSNDDRKQASDQGHSNEEISGEKNDWKFREPYKIHKEDGGDKFNAVLEGHCHCEKVSKVVDVSKKDVLLREHFTYQYLRSTSN